MYAIARHIQAYPSLELKTQPRFFTLFLSFVWQSFNLCCKKSGKTLSFGVQSTSLLCNYLVAGVSKKILFRVSEEIMDLLLYRLIIQ
jgi:hypothetical protein